MINPFIDDFFCLSARDLRTENLILRAFHILLIPFKNLVVIMGLLILLAWLFSFFGLLWFFMDIPDELKVLVIVVDSVLALWWFFANLFRNKSKNV